MVNALQYIFLAIVIAIAVLASGLALYWASLPPNALDDELSRVDVDTDRAELEAKTRPILG